MSFIDLLKPQTMQTMQTIQENQESIYGFCPECSSRGVVRERRVNGDDTCENGHKYPSISALKEPVTREIVEANTAEDILRSAGYKIRLVIPTSFGTQIDLAKSYNPDDITNVLSDFQIKIKEKSIFIIN